MSKARSVLPNRRFIVEGSFGVELRAVLVHEAARMRRSTQVDSETLSLLHELCAFGHCMRSLLSLLRGGRARGMAIEMQGLGNSLGRLGEVILNLERSVLARSGELELLGDQLFKSGLLLEEAAKKGASANT